MATESQEAAALETRLRFFLGGGHDSFEELALAVFQHQARVVPAYRGLLAGRGLDPGSVRDWREIPPVPVRAFRSLPLVSGGEAGAARAQATFRTSGTTGGEGARGRHSVLDLSLYRASVVPNAARHLNPRGQPLRVIGLVPQPADRPDSSLAAMTEILAEAWDPAGGHFVADAGWRLDLARLGQAIEDARGAGLPVLLIGTAFAFVHVLDEGLPGRRQSGPGKGTGPASGAKASRWLLPPGSVVVETGGFKGRSRTVGRAELYRGIAGRFGLPIGRIVNEYGMTEMLSQFWERAAIEDEPATPGERTLHGPPWVRTRVLDPETLAPQEEGTPGLLAHLDLANLHSVSALLTEDLGIAEGEGFRLLGRRPGAEPRGCSLVMEELFGGHGG